MIWCFGGVLNPASVFDCTDEIDYLIIFLSLSGIVGGGLIAFESPIVGDH